MGDVILVGDVVAVTEEVVAVFVVGDVNADVRDVDVEDVDVGDVDGRCYWDVDVIGDVAIAAIVVKFVVTLLELRQVLLITQLIEQKS